MLGVALNFVVVYSRIGLRRIHAGLAGEVFGKSLDGRERLHF